MINLSMENGAACVEVITPEGDQAELPDTGDMTLVEQIEDALCFAKAQATEGSTEAFAEGEPEWVTVEIYEDCFSCREHFNATGDTHSDCEDCGGKIEYIEHRRCKVVPTPNPPQTEGE